MSRQVRTAVGRVIKPHGIRGEVVVQLLSDRPERFAPGAVVESDDLTLTVSSSRPHQGRLLVAFEGVPDRASAERLRGLELTAEPIDDDGDTYLTSELIGMRVVSEDGTELGRVRAVVELPTAAEYDLLEIARADGSTWLLPAVDEYVSAQPGAGGSDELVLTDPPAGLLDEERAVEVHPAED